jgi:hypothetical protein
MRASEDWSDPTGEPIAEGYSAGSVHVPELILYECIDFGGASWRTNLGHSTLGDEWSCGFRSLIVVSGSWVFYEDHDFGGASTQLEPGYFSIRA